jgi:hypothetical protein
MKRGSCARVRLDSGEGGEDREVRPRGETRKALTRKEYRGCGIEWRGVCARVGWVDGDAGIDERGKDGFVCRRFWALRMVSNAVVHVLESNCLWDIVEVHSSRLHSNTVRRIPEGTLIGSPRGKL